LQSKSCWYKYTYLLKYWLRSRNSNPLLFYLSQIFLSILAQVSVEQIFSSFNFFSVFTAFANVNANVNHVIIIIEKEFFTFLVWNKEKITNKKLKLPCHSILFFLISNITLFSFSYVKAKMRFAFSPKTCVALRANRL
jgi:hypothetical protein